mgnify:CR=1 FL=1
MEQPIITKINEDHIKYFYEFLNHHHETELRFIQPGLPQIQLWVNNYENLLKKIKEYNGKYNIYVGINERIERGDKDEDVELITHIGHDIDAHSGKQEDIIKAKELALKIKNDFVEKGYVEPLLMYSGRGYWIIHNVEIQNSDENIKKIKEFGKQIRDTYKMNEIEIDSSVYNPSRIVRVPGTINIKHPDKILSYIINEPKKEKDHKLNKEILNIKFPTYYNTSQSQTTTTQSTQSINSFMDYCLTHEIPKGERHKVISRNMAIYIFNHPDRELLKEQYTKIQKGSEGELDGWLKDIDKKGKEQYPFYIGELINFTKKYKIPFDWKITPEYQQWIKEKKAEKNLKKVIENETKEQELKKDGAYLFQSIGNFTDFLGMAKTFIQKQPVFYDKNKMWWAWNHLEKQWIIVDEIDLLNIIDDKTISPTVDQKTKSCILEALKRAGRRNKPEEIKPSWIQFKDKMFDIENDSIFDISHKYFSTNPINWKIGETEETPTIDKLLNSWVPIEDVQRLYEIIAFSIVPKYFIHSFIFLYGPPGTGKSSFVNLLIKFIGDHNCIATSIDRINRNSRFETRNWYRKLLITQSEVSNIDDLKNSGLINQATGEDKIAAEVKGGGNFDFINYGKFIYSTNKLFKVDPEDGFGRRVRTIKFINRFEKEKDILEEIPNWEFENLAKKCLRIAKELWKKRSFTGDVSISERMKKYQEISKTPLELFINQYCDITDFNAKILFDEFYSTYVQKMERNDSKIKISKDLKILGFEIKLENWKEQIIQQILKTQNYHGQDELTTIWTSGRRISGIALK